MAFEMAFEMAFKTPCRAGLVVAGAMMFALPSALAESKSLPNSPLPTEQCYFLGHTRLLTIPGQIHGALPIASGRAFIFFRANQDLSRPHVGLQIGRGVGSGAIASLTSKDLKEVKEFDNGDKISEIDVSPDGRYSLLSAGGAGFIVDTNTLKITKISDDFDGGFFSANGRLLILQLDDSISVYNIANRKLTAVASRGPKTVIATDRSSENVFVVNYERFPNLVKDTTWLKTQTGEKSTVAGSGVSISKSNSLANKTVIHVNGSQFELFKPRWSRTNTTEIQSGSYDYSDGFSKTSLSFRQGGRKIDLSIPLGNWEARPTQSITDEMVVTSIFRGDTTTLSAFEKTKFVCAKPVTIACVDCEEPSGQDRSIRAYSDQGAAFNDKTLCETPYDARDPRWKNFSAPLKGTTDRGAVERWLIRMSKKGGFRAAEHLPVLEGILADQSISKGYGSLLSLVLANVMSESTNLYSSLLLKYPSVRNLPKAEAACLSPEEKTHYSQFAYTVLKRQLLLSHYDRPFKEYRYFTQFSPFLSDIEKDEFADLIGEGASRYAVQRDPSLRAIFFSKVYQFAYQNARRVMGLPFNEITDITPGQKWGTTVATVILGTSKISDKSKITEAGFFMEEGPQFTYNAQGAFEQSADGAWTHAGKEYTVKFLAKSIPVESNWILTEPSIRYAELHSDKVLRGVVVAGSNLGNARDTLNEYRSYYENDEFKFEKPVLVQNFAEYLKAKVTGPDPMDYMIKEAHSDGDDKNLFRMTIQASVLVGTKTTKDRVEVVELVSPVFDKGTDVIPNAMFGEWVRAREKAKIGQLVYINGSCWSHNKAAAELSAAHSSTLVEIATTTLAYTFADHPRSAPRILTEGIRKNLNYAQIREQLENNQGYKEKKSDVYIFPDQGEYQQITASLRTPFDLTLSVFERERNSNRLFPYHMDERIHQ